MNQFPINDCMYMCGCIQARSMIDVLMIFLNLGELADAISAQISVDHSRVV